MEIKAPGSPADWVWRQAVGKVDIETTSLLFDEWVPLELILDGGLSGCSHGNSAEPPPSGGGDGYAHFRVDSPLLGGGLAIINSYANLKKKPKYFHILNFYIGRANENGEPWLFPGNSISMRIQERVKNPPVFKTIYTRDIYKAPKYKNNTIHEITGPVNINFDLVYPVALASQSAPNWSMQFKLTGNETGQQGDVTVLGEKTGYWAIEKIGQEFVF